MDFIKISRKILEWEWYRDINTKSVFLHILIKANWKDSEYRGRVVKRGELAMSYKQLGDELGLSMRQVRTAISHLTSTGEISVETTNKFSVFTVNNYEEYQSVSFRSTATVYRFDDFIREYPGELNEDMTMEQYRKIVESGQATEDELVLCAHNYAEASRIKKTDESYIKRAENFLKDKYYKNYTPDRYKKPASPKIQSIESYNQFMHSSYDMEALEKELLEN